MEYQSDAKPQSPAEPEELNEHLWVFFDTAVVWIVELLPIFVIGFMNIWLVVAETGHSLVLLLYPELGVVWILAVFIGTNALVSLLTIRLTWFVSAKLDEPSTEEIKRAWIGLRQYVWLLKHRISRYRQHRQLAGDISEIERTAALRQAAVQQMSENFAQLYAQVAEAMKRLDQLEQEAPHSMPKHKEQLQEVVDLHLETLRKNTEAANKELLAQVNREYQKR